MFIKVLSKKELFTNGSVVFGVWVDSLKPSSSDSENEQQKHLLTLLTSACFSSETARSFFF